MFLKIDVIKNFEIFKRKHLCWSFFLIKLKAYEQLFYIKPSVASLDLSMSKEIDTDIRTEKGRFTKIFNLKNSILDTVFLP